MKTDTENQPAELRALRAFARYQTHGGYAWGAVMSDGALLCERCVLANYRQVFRATRDGHHNDWAVAGLTNSGECEHAEHCANCNKQLWEHMT